ncbi:MAG TPA: hypothetical protein PKE59_00140 [Novosphingobium sp.]|jgi:hypothetical protein|nr:hypothetical protein [Novosphingobium sp.]
MNRTEWKAFHHSIRADARAFRESHGGYPCFTRHLQHNDEEWSFTRARNDGIRWTSNLRKSLIRQRPTGGKIADELDTAQDHRRAMRRAPWTATTHKRGIRIAIRIAREIRLAA